MLETKIKRKISFLLSIIFILNLFFYYPDAYSTPSDIGTFNNLETDYDGSEWLNYGSFKVKDDLLSSTGSFYYDLGYSAGKIGFYENDYFNGKIARVPTGSGYVGMISGITKYSFDNIFPKLSAGTNEINTQYNYHTNLITQFTGSFLQTNTGYGLWIDRNGNFNGRIHNKKGYGESVGTTSWRPMPFDTDGDGIPNEKESWFLTGTTVDSSNGDWDSDGDGWGDNEEVLFGSDPLLNTETPAETLSLSSGSFITELFYDQFLDTATCTGKTAYDDCDGDGISNREEQWNRTNPTLADTDGDGVSDYIEILFGMYPNNPYDAGTASVDSGGNSHKFDFDRDGLPNYIELSGTGLTITYENSIGNDVSYDVDVYLDIWNADTDNDGISDYTELYTNFTNPLYWDSDFDMVVDGVESFTGGVNFSALDSGDNTDKYGYDGVLGTYGGDKDILPTDFELAYENGGTSSSLIPMIFSGGVKSSGSEVTVFLGNTYDLNTGLSDSNGNYVYDGNEDFDNDGLTNYEEYFFGRDLNNWDSDGDGVADSDEVHYGLLPFGNIVATNDQDNDGISDIDELSGFSIDVEVDSSTTTIDGIYLDPNDNDSDNDGVLDYDEIRYNLNPTNPDTDGDGIMDGIEIHLGGDPNDSTSTLTDTDGDGLYDVFEDRYTNGSGTLVFTGGIMITGYLQLESSVINASGVTYDLDRNEVNSDSAIWSDAFEDFDGDGLTNFDEQVKGTDPFDWDTDNDGINDYFDDAIDVGLQECTDFEGDGLCDIFEVYYDQGDNHSGQVLYTGGLVIDVDGDVDYSLEYSDGDSNSNPDGLMPDRLEDFDGDGVLNWEEQLYGTDANSYDTDGDGVSDRYEIDNGLDYLTCNGDNDVGAGTLGTYDCSIDMDHDGISNKDELFGRTTSNASGSQFGVTFYTDYLVYDNDGDGLSDGHERKLGINPINYDTDGDFWYDGIEASVGFIETYLNQSTSWSGWLATGFTFTGDPDDDTEFPVDADGDRMADIWEDYFINTWLADFDEPISYDGDLSNLKDSDLDGLTDWQEMLYGTNPLVGNNKILLPNPIYLNQTSSGCAAISAWSNSGVDLSVISPLNTINQDIYNSGFWNYSVQPSRSGFTLANLLNEEIFSVLTFSGSTRLFTGANVEEFRSDIDSLRSSGSLFVNLSQTGSNLSGSLVSTSTYTGNLAPIGINNYSVEIIKDSYIPYVGFGVFDYRFGKPWDDFQLVYYLGKSCIDTTSPVCSIILKGGRHEVREGRDDASTWIENIGWNDGAGGTGDILSMTGTVADISVYTGVIVQESISLDDYTYTGDLVISQTGSIPWTRGITSYSHTYKDNLSGLDLATGAILDDGSILSEGNLSVMTGQTLKVLGDTGTGYSLCDSANILSCSTATDFNNKQVSIIISDLAGNTGSCISQVAKVDDTAPVVKIHDIYDDNELGAGIETGTTIASFAPGRGNTMDISLIDSKAYSGSNIYDYDNETPVINGVSSFKPSDFKLRKLYHCGNGEESRDNCINDFENNLDDITLLNDKYSYLGTGSELTYAGSDLQDQFISTGVFFMKDAYFVNTGVLVNNIGSRDIEITSTGDTAQVLVTKTGSYLATNTGFFLVSSGTIAFNGDSDLNSTGLVATEYKNGWDYAVSGATIRGKVAFRLFTGPGFSLEHEDEYFLLDFGFKDRAGNSLIVKNGLKTRDSIYAKVLGNIISSDKDEKIYDSRVQKFYQKESKVSDVVNGIKQNLKNILANAKDLGGTGILVDDISDLYDYRIDTGGENIYLVKNGDIILGDGGTGTISLGSASGDRPVSIITYGGNIFLNSKFIDSSANTAIVALVDPKLSTLSGKSREAQGNVFINPELLAGKGQLIAESSILSFAKISGILELSFQEVLRRSLFNKQLVWDGSFVSNNSFGGHYNRTCPISLYGTNNQCDIRDGGIRHDISMLYDLHFLRMFDTDRNTFVIDDSKLYGLNEIGSGHILYNTISEIRTNNNIFIDNFKGYSNGDSIDKLKFVSDIDSIPDVPDSLKDTIKSVFHLRKYPAIIKHSVPGKKMMIFDN